MFCLFSKKVLFVVCKFFFVLMFWIFWKVVSFFFKRVCFFLFAGDCLFSTFFFFSNKKNVFSQRGLVLFSVNGVSSYCYLDSTKSPDGAWTRVNASWKKTTNVRCENVVPKWTVSRIKTSFKSVLRHRSNSKPLAINSSQWTLEYKTHLPLEIIAFLLRLTLQNWRGTDSKAPRKTQVGPQRWKLHRWLNHPWWTQDPH